jgi:hypothetical protein
MIGGDQTAPHSHSPLGQGAVPYPDANTSVQDVVKIGAETWLVTRQADGKPGPLRRVVPQ